MRKIAVLLLCLALMGPWAMGETMWLRKFDYSAFLADSGGAILVEPGLYSGADEISDDDCQRERRMYAAHEAEQDSGMMETYQFGWYDAGKSSLGALMNARGEALTACEYRYLKHDSRAGVVVACRDDLMFGAFDEAGNVVMDFVYSGLVSDGEGGFFAVPKESVRIDDQGYEWGRLWHIAPDGSGKDTGVETYPPLLETYWGQVVLWEVCDGLFCAYFADEEAYGFLDLNGDIALEPKYHNSYWFNQGFHNGLTVASIDGEYRGILRKDGSWALEPSYTSIIGEWWAGESFAATRQNCVDIIDAANFSVLATYGSEENPVNYCEHIQTALYRLQMENGNGTLYLGQDGEILHSEPSGSSTHLFDAYLSNSDNTVNRFLATTDMEDGGFTNTLVDMDFKPVYGPCAAIYELCWRNGQGRYLAIQDRYDDTGALIDQDGNVILAQCPRIYNYDITRDGLFQDEIDWKVCARDVWTGEVVIRTDVLYEEIPTGWALVTREPSTADP